MTWTSSPRPAGATPAGGDATEPAPISRKQIHPELGPETQKLHVNKCRPRASGGVPAGSIWLLLLAKSSPRERGCSRPGDRCDGADEVVPARAGVFPVDQCQFEWFRCRPRASGGVPVRPVRSSVNNESSPRERGCSDVRDVRGARRAVVPARAGVFPVGAQRAQTQPCRPRASGGVPRPTAERSSWSTVVPARAGVFPRSHRD